MKRLSVLLLGLSSCAGFDLAPDEFGIEYGRGDGSIEGHKNSWDTEGDWVALDLTWYVARPYIERELERQSVLIGNLMQAALAKPEPALPPTIVCQHEHEHAKEPEPAPEPKVEEKPHDSGLGIETEQLVYGGFTLLGLLTAYLKRRWIADQGRRVRGALRRGSSAEGGEDASAGMVEAGQDDEPV